MLKMWSDKSYFWKNRQSKYLRCCNYELSTIESYNRSMRRARRRTWHIFCLLLAVTVIHASFVILQHISDHIANSSFRWYRVEQKCDILSHKQLIDLHDLTFRSNKAFEVLGVSAPVCFGTLWGVLRIGDVLPWDTNVDFCVMNENLQNISYVEMEAAFNREGVAIHDFSLYSGSYHLQRGNAHGFLNVFMNCSKVFSWIYPELNPDSVDEGDEEFHWACFYSVASFIGKLTYDFNRVFPAWILSPPFKNRTLGSINVFVPNDGIEMQKYTYPEDWWLQTRPVGCS